MIFLNTSVRVCVCVLVSENKISKNTYSKSLQCCAKDFFALEQQNKSSVKEISNHFLNDKSFHRKENSRKERAAEMSDHPHSTTPADYGVSFELHTTDWSSRIELEN
jgi:hypothetical protein